MNLSVKNCLKPIKYLYLTGTRCQEGKRLLREIASVNVTLNHAKQTVLFLGYGKGVYICLEVFPGFPPSLRSLLYF